MTISDHENSYSNSATSICSQTHESIPVLQESMLCLSNIALHGVIFNGFLVWVDILRIEELTEAKEILWDVAGNDIIGKIIKHQGPTKSISEINDICIALKKLAENESMLLFLGTSKVLMEIPL